VLEDEASSGVVGGRDPRLSPHFFFSHPFGLGFLHRKLRVLQSRVTCQRSRRGSRIAAACAWLRREQAAALTDAARQAGGPGSPSHGFPHRTVLPRHHTTLLSPRHSSWQLQARVYLGGGRGTVTGELWGNKQELGLQLSCERLRSELGTSLLPCRFRNRMYGS